MLGIKIGLLMNQGYVIPNRLFKEKLNSANTEDADMDCPDDVSVQMIQ